MAIIAPSALVSGISGSVGGVTFKNTRTGFVAARTGIRSNPASSYQLESRRIRLQCLGYFRSLNETRLKAWQDAARAYNRRNRLGLSALASPWSLFLEANYYFIATGSTANVFAASAIHYPGPEYIQAWFPTTQAWLINPYPPVESLPGPLFALHAARTFSPAYSHTAPQMVYCPNAFWDEPSPTSCHMYFQDDLEARQGVALLYEMIEVSVRYYAVGFLPSVPALTRWRVGPTDQPKP